MTGLALFISVFLACAVEAVEATTIVLAAGTARDWKSSLMGTGSALGVLAIVIGAFGPSISHLPINSLRLFVGGLLLVFGLQWVRKAILRASGYKALHDEDAIFQEEIAAAKIANEGKKFGVHDWYSFTLSFKGVLLEGLEVAFIVLTFGTSVIDLYSCKHVNLLDLYICFVFSDVKLLELLVQLFFFLFLHKFL